MKNFCECGCGLETKKENRYIYGHNRKGKHNTKIHNSRIGDANRGKSRKGTWNKGLTKYTDERLAELSRANKGCKYNGEICPHCNKIHKKYKNINKKGHKFNGLICPICKKIHPDITGDNHPIKKMEKYKKIIMYKKISDKLKGRKLSKEQIELLKGKMIGHKRNGLTCPKCGKIHCNTTGENSNANLPHVRKKISEYMKKNSSMKIPEIAEKAFRSRLKNKPYVYKNIHFQSKQEIECYKFLEIQNKSFTYQFQINTWFIDFAILDINGNPVLFWEHHPLRQPFKQDNFNQYYAQRRFILDNNGYENIPLVITKHLKERFNIKI